jgi:hypothetical protein
MHLDRGLPTHRREVDEPLDSRTLSDGGRNATGSLRRRKADHHRFRIVGDIPSGRRGPRSDEGFHHLGTRVERDDIVAGRHHASCDGKSHVAQADKPDVHDS